MRQSKAIPPKYSILIICEGDKTEPFFFEGLISHLNRKGYKGKNRSFEYRIFPFPDESPKKDSQGKGRQTRNLSLKNGNLPLPDIKIQGAQPVCWVNAGVEQLSVFSEVWVVFDQDERHHNPEALNIIRDKRREGQNIHLAFSSRCFEMYLLEHYEYCYKAFDKSECDVKRNGKTRYLKCMLPDSEEGSCQGDKCINGYARKQGYWLDSKNSEVFQIVTNLWYGVLNSHKLKWHSLSTESVDKEIYDRNPYLNTYRLTLRLMDTNILESGDVVRVEKGNGHYQILSREKNLIRFVNKSILPLKMDGIFRVYLADKTLDVLEEKLIEEKPKGNIIIRENDSFEYNLSELLIDNTYLKFCWEGNEYFCALEDDVPLGIDISRFQVS